MLERFIVYQITDPKDLWYTKHSEIITGELKYEHNYT